MHSFRARIQPAVQASLDAAASGAQVLGQRFTAEHVDGARIEQPHCGPGGYAPCACPDCRGQERSPRQARSEADAAALLCHCANCSCA